MKWVGWVGMLWTGRVEDKTGGGRGRGTVFLGNYLGMGIAVGTGSLAVDWRWASY